MGTGNCKQHNSEAYTPWKISVILRYSMIPITIVYGCFMYLISQTVLREVLYLLYGETSNKEHNITLSYKKQCYMNGLYNLVMCEAVLYTSSI